jgi:hypothetical protein
MELLRLGRTTGDQAEGYYEESSESLHSRFESSTILSLKKKATLCEDRYKEARREGNLQGRRCKVLFQKERPTRSRECWKRIEVMESLRPLLLPSLRAFPSPKRLMDGVAANELTSF